MHRSHFFILLLKNYFTYTHTVTAWSAVCVLLFHFFNNFKMAVLQLHFHMISRIEVIEGIVLVEFFAKNSQVRILNWGGGSTLLWSSWKLVTPKFQLFSSVKGIIVRSEFVLQSQTMNSASYCNVLRRLRVEIRKKNDWNFSVRRVFHCIATVRHLKSSVCMPEFSVNNSTRIFCSYENEVERPSFWNDWRNTKGIAGSTSSCHRKRVWKCISAMEKEVEPVHCSVGRLL